MHASRFACRLFTSQAQYSHGHNHSFIALRTRTPPTQVRQCMQWRSGFVRYFRTRRVQKTPTMWDIFMCVCQFHGHPWTDPYTFQQSINVHSRCESIFCVLQPNMAGTPSGCRLRNIDTTCAQHYYQSMQIYKYLCDAKRSAGISVLLVPVMCISERCWGGAWLFGNAFCDLRFARTLWTLDAHRASTTAARGVMLYDVHYTI